MKFAVDGPGGQCQAYAYTGGKRFDPSLPAIVFVHGAMYDHSAWTLLARWFAHHGQAVLAPDLPGHGQSTGKPLESVEAIADWLLTFLDAVADPEELRSLPLWRAHVLTGDRKGTWSLSVTRNRRLTFRIENDEIVDLNLEDYH